jgi:hypothetical protein
VVNNLKLKKHLQPGAAPVVRWLAVCSSGRRERLTLVRPLIMHISNVRSEERFGE